MKHAQCLALMSLATEAYRSIGRAVGKQLDLERIKRARPTILRRLLELLCAAMLCSLVVAGGTASETPKVANAQDLEAVNKRLQSAGDKIWSAADDEISTADEWEELTEAQVNWRHGPKNNHIGVSLPAFEYAKMIESELGVPPVVDLGASVEIPIFVDGKKYTGDPGIHCCDNPSLQMGDCMSGSSLQRYEGKTRDGKQLPHVVWISFARHDGRDNVWKRDIPDSVQLIGHNKTTGAPHSSRAATTRSGLVLTRRRTG